MTTIRKFCCDDLLRFSSVNLDHLTITESMRTYFSWLSQWPDYFNVAVAPGKRIMAYIVAAIKGEGEEEEDQGSLAVAGGVQEQVGEGWFGQVTTVSVHPEYRRRGLGTKLMRMFESQLLDKMYFSPGDLSYSMRCYVGVSNKPARIFFGKFGFQEHRCQSGFISKKEDAVDMRKVLVDGGDFDLLRSSTYKEIELNHDVLGLIVQKVCHSADFSTFGQVCKEWKKILWENIRYLPLGRFPGVLAAGETPQTRRLFQFNHLNGFFEEIASLAIPHTFICKGSAFGWVFLADDNLDTKLYNPFSIKEFNLPSLKTLPNNLVDCQITKSCVCKAIFSSNPSCLPYPIILVIVGVDLSRLAFCELGDDKWSILSCEDFYTDAVYLNQKFYALRASGQVIAFDIKGNGQGDYSIYRTIIAPASGISKVIHMYLVEVEGVLVRISRELGLVEESRELGLVEESRELGLVEEQEINDDIDDDDDDDNEIYTDDDDETNNDDIYSKHWKWLVVGFRMQKFDNNEWANLENLGDYSLFVGLNTSFSLRAADFPGCIPNAVYFGGSEGFEIGIFSLSTQSVNRHVTNPPFSTNDSTFPLWIDHTLWSLHELDRTNDIYREST